MIRTAHVQTGAPMNKAEAKAITRRIKGAVDDLYILVDQAYQRKAWKVLGYTSWEAYVRAEFDMSRGHSYRLIDYAEVIREIDKAAGENVSHGRQISEREARDIKGNLPAVTAEIKARVADGEEPAKAISKTIAEQRAHGSVIQEVIELIRGTKLDTGTYLDKLKRLTPNDQFTAAKRDLAHVRSKEREIRAKQKPANPDHSAFHEQQSAALPEAIKAQQEFRAQRKKPTEAERVAELELEVAALAGEIGALKDENARYSDMRVQFEQGGFEKVIAGRDEEIRVLKARLSQESEDKAGWARKAKTWQKRAIDLGWSSDEVIPIEQPNAEVIPL